MQCCGTVSSGQLASSLCHLSLLSCKGIKLLDSTCGVLKQHHVSGILKIKNKKIKKKVGVDGGRGEVGNRKRKEKKKKKVGGRFRGGTIAAYTTVSLGKYLKQGNP